MVTSKLSILLAPLSLLACSASAVQPERNLTASLAGQIHVFESEMGGFNTKNFFYDNGEEVVVFDAQFTPETAQKSIDFLRTKTANPIRYVVLTHPNPDKFNGISVFQAQGAKVIASRATALAMNGVHEYKKYFFVNLAKMFTEDSYPKLSRPDVIFDQSHLLRLDNGETIELSELSAPGVSSNQTVAFIPKANALLVGDLVHYRAHAWLEGGIVNGKPSPTLAGWAADLNELRARFGKQNPMVYGGRGEAARLSVAVASQLTYLSRADRIVTEYLNPLGTKKVELAGDQAAAHHAELQKRIEAAFPGYSLGYLIQYGVYGLVNSKL